MIHVFNSEMNGWDFEGPNEDSFTPIFNYMKKD